MKTELNYKIENFFSTYKLEEITTESILNFFKDIHEKNDYGNYLHACVHNRFDEKKVLRFIDLLLSLGVSCNVKGERTGYTFIHLALYGYTKDYSDHSYSTDFIVKLIEIAKKYNFDVQSVDLDEDSIVHTALASEVYTGSTIEILKALGNKYDVLCKDKNGNDIHKALLKYKQEAEETRNDQWHRRLSLEEKEIKKQVELSKYNITEINQILLEIKNNFEMIMSEINILYLLNNYSDILELKDKFESFLERQHLFIEEETEYDGLWLKYEDILKKVIVEYIKELSKSPSYVDINNLTLVLNSFGYKEELSLLSDMKTKYDEYIKSLRKSISCSNTLGELKILKDAIILMKDSELKEELLMEYDKKYDVFKNKIQKIKQLSSLIVLGDCWLEDIAINNDITYEDISNYNEIGIEELDKMISEGSKLLSISKDKISNTIGKKINCVLQNIFLLEECNLFTSDELWGTIDSSIIVYKNDLVKGQKTDLEKEKNKVKTKGKN